MSCSSSWSLLADAWPIRFLTLTPVLSMARIGWMADRMLGNRRGCRISWLASSCFIRWRSWQENTYIQRINKIHADITLIQVVISYQIQSIWKLYVYQNLEHAMGCIALKHLFSFTVTILMCYDNGEPILQINNFYLMYYSYTGTQSPHDTLPITTRNTSPLVSTNLRSFETCGTVLCYNWQLLLK